jgi:hypothetical protein
MPTTNAPNAKPTARPSVSENKVEDTKVALPAEVVADDKVEATKPRIPTYLADNSILADFCKRYLATFDKIAAYNKDVLAEKDSEWNAAKVLEKSREMARPTDKNAKADEEVKNALEAWESLITELAKARKAVLDLTASKLNINLSATATRDNEVEAPLKEDRKVAVEIGKQLSMIADMTNDESASAAVLEFLANNPLPAVGRDQSRNFGAADSASTPKYRVKVTVTKDGEEILSEDGFTKAGLALTKPVFGYERGKAPKSETLRNAWEAAGNNGEKTVVNPVEFDDNGLHFVITKK